MPIFTALNYNCAWLHITHGETYIWPLVYGSIFPSSTQHSALRTVVTIGFNFSMIITHKFKLHNKDNISPCASNQLWLLNASKIIIDIREHMHVALVQFIVNR